MNLLSDLSSELAVAILVDKNRTEKVDSKQALELLEKVYKTLEHIPTEEIINNYLIQTGTLKAANH